jgi:hypothetical protein
VARDRKSKAKQKGPGRGGARPGAGRPRERPGPGGIKWTIVRRYARLGADRDLIVRALGLLPEQLRDPEVLARFQLEIERGEAQHQVELLEDVKRLRRGGDGKVNAVLASLKHALGWGKPDTGKGSAEQRPDNGAAVAEVQRMLRRFGAAG